MRIGHSERGRERERERRKRKEEQERGRERNRGREGGREREIGRRRGKRWEGRYIAEHVEQAAVRVIREAGARLLCQTLHNLFSPRAR